jgi:hypothetical protein
MHFDPVMEYLAATLREPGVTDGQIQKVADKAESTRYDVLDRSASGDCLEASASSAHRHLPYGPAKAGGGEVR